MGIPLSEDPTAAGVDPETPAQHATEGVSSPSGASLAFVFDLDTAGIPREAQRLISTTVDYGFDHLQASGATTNLGKWWIDAARRKLYDVYRKLLRVYFILGPDGNAWFPGVDNGFISRHVFAATGSGTTISLSNYAISNAKNMDGSAITPYEDYAYCDEGGAQDITMIIGCSIGDSSASITTVQPLNPAAYSNVVVIVKPTTRPVFPLIREDRTLLCERKETAWIAKASLASDYTFSSKRIAYPLVWTFYEGGGVQFIGTFRVLASETNTGDGTGVIDLTSDILGATPASGYNYPKFPSDTGNLKFQNVGDSAFKTTLNLAGVSVPGSKLFIKILYCEEIPNPASPDENTISPTQTSCAFDIIPPDNAAVNSYTGSGDINDVIKSGHFCTKHDSLNAAEVAAYRSYCNNTTCRFFEVWEGGYIPQPIDELLFWGGKGNYTLQDNVGEPEVTFGRDQHDGLLTLIGFYVYSSAGLSILNKQWKNQARFLYRTGSQGADGFDIFETLGDSVASSGESGDNVGLFGTINAYISKKDPGGATEADKTLDSRGGFLAGHAFELTAANRRIGYTTMGLTSTPSGPGSAEVQRPRPIRYTSQTFSRQEVGEMKTDGLTRITFLAIAVTVGSLACDAKLEVPKYGSRVVDEKPVHDKGLSSAIFSSSISGNLLLLNMALGTTTQTIQDGPGATTDEDYTSGGLFASGENAWQDRNPASAFLFGSRQERCTVGDVLTIQGRECQVIGTRVLDPANVTQTGGVTAPNIAGPGLTNRILDYYDKCDFIVCSLEGLDGDGLRALHTTLGSFAGLDVDSVKHSAVAPPQIYYDGSEGLTGYEPVITVVDMLDTVTPFRKTVLVAGTHYEWSPTDGVLWLKRSAMPYDSDLRIHFQGHVYDTRQTLYAEDWNNLQTAFDSLLDNGYIIGVPPFAGGVNVELVLDNGIDTPEALHITPKGAHDDPTDPGYYNWDFPDDSEIFINYPPPSDLTGDDLKWVTTEVDNYEVGATITNPSPFNDITFRCRFPVMFLPVLQHIHVDELSICYLEMSLENASMFHHFQYIDKDAEPPIAESLLEVIDDDVEIKLLVAWYEEDGGVVTIVEVEDSLSITATFKKVTVGENVFLRVTADITACQKAAITSRNQNAERRLILIPFPAAAIPDDFDISGKVLTEIVYSAVSAFDASNYNEFGIPSQHNVELWNLVFDGMSLGTMRYKIDKDNLKTANWYADETGVNRSPALDWIGP